MTAETIAPLSLLMLTIASLSSFHFQQALHVKQQDCLGQHEVPGFEARSPAACLCLVSQIIPGK